MQIKEIVNRLAEIKSQQADLKSESDKLQAEILATAEDALKDTKIKSISYAGDEGNKITATMADTVSNVSPTLFREIFGKTYADFVKEETTYTLTAPAKRLLTALWNQEYCEGSIKTIIDKLPCDDKKKKSLEKKLKGVNFETDKKNLINLGGLSEEESSDYAYLIAEVAAWSTLECLLKLNYGDVNEKVIEDIKKKVDVAVVVTQSTKLKIDVGEIEQSA